MNYVNNRICVKDKVCDLNVKLKTGLKPPFALESYRQYKSPTSPTSGNNLLVNISVEVHTVCREHVSPHLQSEIISPLEFILTHQLYNVQIICYHVDM